MRLIALAFICVYCHITVSAQNKSLPEFSFLNSKNQRITPASLPVGQPIVVFYFDPFCDHCKEQAKIVTPDAAKFGKTTFVWVSLGEMEDNETFKKENLKSFPRAFVCNDTEFKFDSWFGYSEVPSVFIYNNERNLTARFDKVSSAKDILDACNKKL